MEQRRQHEERSTQTGDFAAHGEAAERLEGLKVGEKERPVADCRRKTAQRYGAADALDRAPDVPAEQARSIVYVERVLAPDAEGDRQSDEVHVIELLAQPGCTTHY